jgi:hypothetical protein
MMKTWGAHKNAARGVFQRPAWPCLKEKDGQPQSAKIKPRTAKSLIENSNLLGYFCSKLE